MRKNKKTDNLLKKFKIIYHDIFFNISLNKKSKNHFDSKLGFACFTIALIENQIGKKAMVKHIQINKEEWLRLINDIYDDEEIKQAYSNLALNPLISLENIEKYFDCFDKSINKIVQYIESEQINIKINPNQLKYIFKSTFGFIMYNCIDCRIFYSLNDILSDPEYDQKLSMILTNTKLFMKSKKSITSNCHFNISNLISLLLGISRDLNYDK